MLVLRDHHGAQSFLNHLAAIVELAAAWSVLRQVITLAEEIPAPTDEQLRFRLLALTACAAPRSPIGRWSAMPPNQLPAAGRSQH